MGDRELEYWDDDGEAFSKIVRAWPQDVRLAIGTDIRRVQQGKEPLNFKPLSGFAVAAAEVRHRSGARVVYSVAYANVSGKVFIADAFMKDSANGSAMRASDRKRIDQRLSRYKSRYASAKRSDVH